MADNDELMASYRDLLVRYEKVAARVAALEAREPPVGSIVPFGGPLDSIPNGWRLCNGDSIDLNAHPEYKVLHEVIQYSWGGHANVFNLPDLRGRFLRGVDLGAGRDAGDRHRPQGASGNDGDRVGSVQEDAFQSHRHGDSGHAHGYHFEQHTRRQYADSGDSLWPPADMGRADATTEGSSANIVEPTASPGIPLRVAAETRPKNANVFFIIKYMAAGP